MTNLEGRRRREDVLNDDILICAFIKVEDCHFLAGRVRDIVPARVGYT
jgi:hypothetical protein